MTSIRELHQQLVNKERSAVEITTEALERINAVDANVKSFLQVTADHALETAKKVDEKIANNQK